MGKPISLILEAPEERLPAQAFLVGIRSFLGLLRDLDVAVSKDPRGTVNWEITGLSMASPAQISCSGSSRLKGIDYTPVIESHIIRGIRLLSERDRDPLYSESALKWTRQLANLRKKGLEYVGVMAGIGAASLDAGVVEAIDMLTQPYEETEGSIVGNLDAIIVHKGNEFRVWDENTGKAIPCYFSDFLMDMAKVYLKKRALVYGTVRLNQLGQVVSIRARGIDDFGNKGNLPTIKEMTGLVDDFTDGLPLSEYMKHLREDD